MRTYKPHHKRYYAKNKKEISLKGKIKRDLFIKGCGNEVKIIRICGEPSYIGRIYYCPDCKEKK